MIQPWELLILREEFHYETSWIDLHIVKGETMSLSVICRGFFYWGFNNLHSDKSIKYWIAKIMNDLFERRHPKAKEFYTSMYEILR